MATRAGALSGWKSRRLKLTASERLWARLDRRNKYACWEWPGNRRPNGYGIIYADGKQRSTHRLSWESTHGEIPAGMLVCHKCDNRLCCNPSHLFLGTQSDNIMDCVSKNRNNHVKGESHPGSVFSEFDIRYIRKMYDSGAKIQQELANEYGVRHGTISKIVRRERWVHIK